MARVKKSPKRAPRDLPRAQERAATAGDASARQASLSEVAREDRNTRAFFEQIASDRKASLTFLKQAGILDAKGALAKPFRG